MPRNNVVHVPGHRRAIMAILDGLTGKPTTQDIVAILDERNLFDIDVEVMKHQLVRSLLKRRRKHHVAAGDIGMAVLNLFETDDEGVTRHYWRKAGEMTPEEAVRFQQIYDRKIGELATERDRYHRFFLDRLGDPYEQLLMDFARPQPHADGL